MRTGRVGLIGAAAFATVGLAVTGCGTSASTDTGQAAASTAPASPSPTLPAPKDALATAVRQLGQSSYAFTTKQANVSGQGKADPAGKAAQVSITGSSSGVSIKLSVVTVGPDTWAQIDLGSALDRQAGIDPKKWMAIDTSKVKKADALPVDPASADLLDFSTIPDAAVAVTRGDATHYSGTIDLTTVKGAVSPDSDTLTKVGDKAKAVPFTATVDGSGRLTEFATDGAGIDPGLTVDVTFSDYGASQNISKPTGTIVPAPSAVYDILNG
jgi:hypothetical protein